MPLGLDLSPFPKVERHVAKRTPKPRRQTSRAKAYSLLGQYGKLRKSADTIALTIEDPYASESHAVLTAVPPPGRSERKDRDIEWRAPSRPRIEVLASTRDVLAWMYARRQIDEAMFQAARRYQQLYERAESLGRVKSVDVSMPPISGIISGRDLVVAEVMEATNELKRIEKQLTQRAGEDGVDLIRDVLARGLTIEKASAMRGDADKTRVAWWGGLFRRSLRHLAEISGFAVPGAYRRRHRITEREQAREKKEAKDGNSGTKEPGPVSASGGVPGRQVSGALRPLVVEHALGG
jgi:hypothetical protein